MIMQLFASVCAGIAVGCTAKLLLDKFTQSTGRGNRLSREQVRSLPLLFQLARPFALLFRPVVTGKTFSSVIRVTAPKLTMAGYGEQLSPENYWCIRLVLFGYAMLILLFGSITRQTAPALLLASFTAFYPDLWLKNCIAIRHRSITNALPNVLDLLTLSVEAGRDIVTGLREIVYRRKMDPLGEELMRTFQEIQLGKKRTDALRDLANRVRLPDLSSTINAIIQAEELGVSIAHLLKIQGDMQRNKRFSLAEKRANESAVKIILPVAIFILPAVFIILLGPLAVQTLRSFGGHL